MPDTAILHRLEFDIPEVAGPVVALFAIGLLAVIVAYLSGLRRHEHLSLARRLVLLGLRLGAIACLVFALLHPTWMKHQTQLKRPVVGVVLDDSQSMQQPPSRYAKAVGVLQGPLRAALGERFRMQVYDVAGNPLDAEHLPATAAATMSPIGDALAAVERDLAGEPLAGIVLLSDGIQNTPRASIARPEELRTRVFPIELATPQATAGLRPDVSIQSVAANRSVLAGNTVRVKVDVATNGAAGSVRVPVWISDGKETGHPIASTTLHLHANEPLARAELEFTPVRTGQYAYMVQVGHVADEINLENNRRTFPLAVHAKAIKVLYVDGVLRWEGKFTREALSADPDVHVAFAVRTSSPAADAASKGMLLPETLAKLDMVILGDVEATYFSAKEIEALGAWVREKGGALMLAGGYHSFGPRGFGRTELRQVLPVTFSNDASPQVEQPFAIQLTEKGKESPIFDLTGNRIHDTAFFHKLPQLGGCSLVAGVKPGAEVLAVNPQVKNPDGQGGLPILVVQQVGAGRAMVFAVDTTWRWRMVMGGYTGDTTFYQRFWGQLVRWMTANDQETPPSLVVATDRSRYDVGQTVKLNVDLSSPRPLGEGPGVRGHGDSTSASTPPHPSPLPKGEGAEPKISYHVSAGALDDEGRPQRIALTELSPTRYQAAFQPSRAGRWDITVVAEPEGPAGGTAKIPVLSQVTTIAVARPDRETLDVEPRPQWLAQLARTTGGRCFPADQAPQLVEQLADAPEEIDEARAVELWRHPLLAGCFFVLLCGEWILRRMYRLA